MNTLKETMDVIKDLDCDNIGLQPDVFHMNIGDDTYSEDSNCNSTCNKGLRRADFQERGEPGIANSGAVHKGTEAICCKHYAIYWRYER